MPVFALPTRPLSPLARLAWGVLAYTLFVILWGAFVRATGAGAGCGAHWPLCNGQVLPRAPEWQTVVEFGHRVTSGIALPLVLWLAWRARRSTPRDDRHGRAVRGAAYASVGFMVLEAAIGAGLVLLEHVAYNVSVARAVWMAAHLVNTFLLVGALALTGWWASGGSVPRLRLDGRTLAHGAALGSVLVLSAGGAITALGDTLVLGGGLDPASDPVVAALVAARVFHPAMAFVSLAFVSLAVWMSRGAGAEVVQRGMLVVGLFALQMALGTLNVWLLAPVWMQLVHLLVSDAIWIALVVFAVEALAVPARRPEPALAA